MINKLVLGTVQLGIPYGVNNATGQPGISDAHAILTCARNAGIDTLDTAKAYGTALQVIGGFHRNSDFSFKVISKFHAGSVELEKNIEEELSLLNINKFEAYLFHSFADFENVSSKTLQVISDQKKNGSLKKIGVSVYGNDQFEKAIKSKNIDIIQLPYNLLDNFYQRGALMQDAKAAGKELHIRSVFLQGLFFMNEDNIPEKIEPLTPYLKKIRELASAENLTVEELAMAYALQNTLIDKVLIGVDSVEQLTKNIEVVSKTKNISAEIMEAVNAIRVKEVNLLSPVNWN